MAIRRHRPGALLGGLGLTQPLIGRFLGHAVTHGVGAFNTSAVPLNSSAMDAISSLFMRDHSGFAGIRVGDPLVRISIDAVGDYGNVASLLAADGYGEGIG